MGLKVKAAIITDMPVQELARVFGPIQIQNGLYVTRIINSADHAKTLVGTAQSRAERYGYKEFGAIIMNANTKPDNRRRKYRVAGPLKARLDYGAPRDTTTNYNEHPQPESFYDRRGSSADDLLPEERASFERWLGIKKGRLTGGDIRVILKKYDDSLEQFSSDDPVFGIRQFLKLIQDITGQLGPVDTKILDSVEALRSLSQLPQYQSAANGNGRPDSLPPMDVTFPTDLAQEHPGGAELEQLSPEMINWILSLPGKVSQEDVQRHIKVMLGLHVPIDRINEFISMLELTVGKKAAASKNFMDNLQEALGQSRRTATYGVRIEDGERKIVIEHRGSLKSFVASEELPTERGKHINVIRVKSTPIQRFVSASQKLVISSHEQYGAGPVKIETMGDVKVLESGPDKLRVRFAGGKYDGTYLFFQRGGKVWRMVKR